MEGRHEPGCKHKATRALLKAECCGNIYFCRMCHDDQEDHPMRVGKVKQIQCVDCKRVQEPAYECQFCKVRFADYICLKCQLFGTNGSPMFHCDKCGLCRAGLESETEHCSKCNICLNKSKVKHKCAPNAGKLDCLVCDCNVGESQKPIRLGECGHYMHSECSDLLLSVKMTLCPVCDNSFVSVAYLKSKNLMN